MFYNYYYVLIQVNGGGEWYLKDAEYREEGGTPDAVGIIRLAMAIKLKRTVGEATIMDRDRKIVRWANC